MVDPDAREPSLIHFNSADLRYKTHETFTSGYTGTIIEELKQRQRKPEAGILINSYRWCWGSSK